MSDVSTNNNKKNTTTTAAAYIGTGVAASRVQTLERLLASVGALVPRQGAALHEVARRHKNNWHSLLHTTMNKHLCACVGATFKTANIRPLSRVRALVFSQMSILTHVSELYLKSKTNPFNFKLHQNMRSCIPPRHR